VPFHVTLRMAPHVYNLRSRRSFRVIAAALRIGGDRFDVRIIEFSVQGNHIHLLVEAPDRRALARAIQGFSIRVARGLNRMMGRSGRVFDDRYHARVLRTPTEVRHAIHYVISNGTPPSAAPPTRPATSIRTRPRALAIWRCRRPRPGSYAKAGSARGPEPGDPQAAGARTGSATQPALWGRCR
jgi:REP element-mobilizing transposase RayT